MIKNETWDIMIIEDMYEEIVSSEITLRMNLYIPKVCNNVSHHRNTEEQKPTKEI